MATEPRALLGKAGVVLLVAILVTSPAVAGVAVAGHASHDATELTSPADRAGYGYPGAVAAGESGPDSALAYDYSLAGLDGYRLSTASANSTLSATRSIADQTLAPGESTEVTVTVEGTDPAIDSIVSPSMASASIVDSDSAFIASADANDVGVIWDSASDPTLVYEVTVPQNASDGDEFFINGTVSDGSGTEVVIGGDTTIEVSSNESVVSFDTDGDSQISFTELLDGISAYEGGSTVNGQNVAYSDVLANTRAFNAGTSVPGPVATGASAGVTATGSVQADPGERFSVVYTLENDGTEYANAAGLSIETPQGVSVWGMNGDGTHILPREDAVFTGGLAAGGSVTVNVTFSVSSNATARTDQITATATAGTEVNVSTDLTIGSGSGGSGSAFDVDQSVVDRYDTDGDGEISITELGDAGSAYALGGISLRDLRDVSIAFARDGTTGANLNVSRSVSDSTVAPGETATVTLTATGVNGSPVILTDEFDADVADATVQSVTVDGQSVTPLIDQSTGGGVLVALSSGDSGGTVEVTYNVTASSTAGTTHAITGGAVTGDAEVRINDTVTVQSQTGTGSAFAVDQSVVDEYDTDGDGEITIQELGSAASSYAFGGISLRDLRDVSIAFARDDSGGANLNVSRSVSDSTVAPGETATVTLTATGVSGSRVTFTDEFDADVADATVQSVTVDGQSVTPLVEQATGGGVLVALSSSSSGDTIEVTYTVTASSTSGTTHTITGGAVTGGAEISVNDTITVSTGGTGGETDTSLATRDIADQTLAPGESTNVTLTLNETTDSVSESFSPNFGGASISGSNRTTFLRQAESGGLIITWQTPVSAGSTVVYEVTVPQNASDGDTFAINGTVTTPSGVSIVGGERNISVQVGATGGNESGASFAKRTLSSSKISPGGSVTVTLTAEVQSDTVTFNETFGPLVGSATFDSASVNGNSVQPTLGLADRNGVVITVGGVQVGDKVTATYTLSVPASANRGDSVRIDGRVTSGSTEGLTSDTLTIQQGSPLSGPPGRYDDDADGNITIAELGDAAAAYAQGKIPITDLGAVASAYAKSGN